MKNNYFHFKYVLCALTFVTRFYHVDVFILHAESIIGGWSARRSDFKYQAAILGIKNYTSQFTLLGGGAIIADRFVLTAAHCFINSSGGIHELSFSVRVGAINLNRLEGYFVEVSRIHLAYYDPILGINDLALVELSTSLNLDINYMLSKLELPSGRNSFGNMKSVVSGYGYTWIEESTISSTGTVGGTDSILKYIEVLILFDIVCKDIFEEFIDTDKQICGVTILENRNDIRSVCKYDDGGPLVIAHEVVGILSKYDSDCDTNTAGSMYTKVSNYADLIRRIMISNSSRDSFIYYNKHHVL